MTDYIGKYVKQFESGSKGSLALGSCGYDWGLSCGSYQLTLRWGNCINFLKKYFPNEAKDLYFKATKDKASKTWPGADYCSSPAKVQTVWTACYNKTGADKFFEYEHQFMEDNYYKPIKNKVKDLIDLDNTNRAFQECFWSWAIHRGVSGAYNEFKNSLGAYKPSHYKTEKLFDLMYDTRYNNANLNRYKKGYSSGEREILRPLLNEPAFGKAVSTTATKMKYSETNKPLQCMMTNSTCYKGTRQMNVLGVLWHSTGANNPNLKRYVQPSPTDANYKQLLSKIGTNTNNNSWNQISIEAGLNAWIGKLADGSVTTVQTMPWNYRPWGCGSGSKGSCNNGWIQFEICEDALSDKSYFDKVYEEAVQLTAYLCKMYNLDPKGSVAMNGVQVPVILCHADSYNLKVGSNHADVLHWFKKYGKTMNDVRNDVSALVGQIIVPPAQTQQPTIEEEEEVTQEQFNKMMDTWIAEQAKKEPGAWSADAREWAERNGLINGNEKGQKMYKKMLTREEFAAVLYRALHRNIVD